MPKSRRTPRDSKRSRNHQDRVLGRSRRSSARLTDLMDKGVGFNDANSGEGVNVNEGIKKLAKGVASYLNTKLGIVATPEESEEMAKVDDELPRGKELKKQTPEEQRRTNFWRSYNQGKKEKEKEEEKDLSEDLRKWVKERWVDIGAPKKGGGFKPCGRSKGEKRSGYPKCVPAAKASRMSKGQRRSAVKRKRAAGNPGGKPTNVATFTKKKKVRK